MEPSDALPLHHGSLGPSAGLLSFLSLRRGLQLRPLPHPPSRCNSPTPLPGAILGAAYLTVRTVLVEVLAHGTQLGVRQNLAWLPCQPLSILLRLLQCPKAVVTG